MSVPARAVSPPRVASLRGAAPLPPLPPTERVGARRRSDVSVAPNRANAEEICPDILDKNVFKKRFDEVQKFLKNGLYYQSVNNAPGALVSYSNAETYVHFMIHLFEHAKSKTDDTGEIGTIDKYIGFLKRLEQQLLGYIEVLQEKTKNLVKSGGGGGKKEDKEEWQEVCQTVIPRVFSGEALTFADVIGLYREKELIRTSFIKPLLLPNLFPALSKGILLFGPPGTGKTYLAKAAITELQGIDPSIGVIFFDPTGADLKGKYVGETEKRITKYFTCAARAACAAQEQSGKINKPKKYISILFVDEFDNVAGDRMSDETGLMANSVNTILQMMDGVQSFKNVAVMAATNYPWKLDAAVLRRFTNQIMINVPSSADILDLLKYEFKKNIKIKSFNYFCYCKDEINDTIYKSGPALDALCPLTFSVKNNVKHTSDDVTFSFPLKKGDTVLGVSYNQLEDEKTGNTKLLIVVNYRDANSLVYTERYEFNVKGRLSSPEIITSIPGTTSPYAEITEQEITEDATRLSTDMQILKGYMEKKMPIAISKQASKVIEKLIEIRAKEKELREERKESKKPALQQALDALKRDEVTERTHLKELVAAASNPIDRRNLRDKQLKDLQLIGERFGNYTDEKINFQQEITSASDMIQQLIQLNEALVEKDKLPANVILQAEYTTKLNIIQFETTQLYNKIYSAFVNIKDYNSLVVANTNSSAVNLDDVIAEIIKLFPYLEGENATYAVTMARIQNTTFEQKQLAISIYEKIMYSSILKRYIELIFTYADKIKVPIEVFRNLQSLLGGDGWNNDDLNFNHKEGEGGNNEEGDDDEGGGGAAEAPCDYTLESYIQELQATIETTRAQVQTETIDRDTQAARLMGLPPGQQGSPKHAAMQKAKLTLAAKERILRETTEKLNKAEAALAEAEKQGAAENAEIQAIIAKRCEEIAAAARAERAKAAAAAKAERVAAKKASNAVVKLTITLGPDDTPAEITNSIFDRLLKRLQKKFPTINSEYVEEILKDTRLSAESDWMASLTDQVFNKDILAFKGYAVKYIDKIIITFKDFKTPFYNSKTIDTFIESLKILDGEILFNTTELNTSRSISNYWTLVKGIVQEVNDSLQETNQSKLASLFIKHPSIITGDVDDDEKEEAAGGEAAPLEEGGGGAAAADIGPRRRHARGHVGGGYRRQTPKKKHMRRQTKRLSR